MPDYCRVSTISCTENGQLWVVTHNGYVLLRCEVSSTDPTGRRWIHLDRPDGASFVSVTASSSQVYALDHKGFVYFRDGLSEGVCLEGTRWIKVLKGLSSISLSKSNQVILFNQVI